MNNQVTTVVTRSIPEVVVTEPSPISSTQNTVSVARKIESIPEIVANGAGRASEPVKASLEQASTKLAETRATVADSAAVANSESNASCESEEFTPAQECNDCVVPVPEHISSHSAEAPSTSTETEPEDHFRAVDMGLNSCGIKLLDYYEKMWNIIHNGYAIPFWLLLLALPVSAGYMSALYMYSCPASHSMPILMFTVGISLMAVLSLRVCLIIRRITATAVDDFRNVLHTLLLIASFLTVVFFITESVAYWKMTATTHPGTHEYCDPQFLTFSFWWNCVMSPVMVLIFFFPA